MLRKSTVLLLRPTHLVHYPTSDDLNRVVFDLTGWPSILKEAMSDGSIRIRHGGGERPT